MTPSTEGKSAVLSNEITLAVRNGFKLMASLGVTLGIAFVVRFWVPRFLGPEMFGIVHFAEQFSLFMAFIVAFGADVYIRKEVSARPEHASDFFGGLLLFRAGLGVVIAIVVGFILWAMKKDAYVWYMVYIFLLAQMLYILNLSLGALLEAKGTVGELAATNAALKVVWGTGTIGGLLLGLGPIAFPIAFCTSETLKTPILYRAARKHLNLQLRFNFPAVKSIVISSLPYWLNSVALGIYSKVGVSILSGMTNDQEVGWYGAAQNLTYIVFLFLPVLRAVVMPMGSRLAQESPEVLAKTMAAAARLLLMFSVPLAALLAFNSQDVVNLLYSETYGPTTVILRVLVAIIPFTYLCTIGSVYLIQVGKIWTVVKITCVAMVISPSSKVLLLTFASESIGDGYGGIIFGLTDIFTEAVVLALLYLNIRRELSDSIKRRIGGLIVRLAIASGLVGAMHPFVGMLGYGRIALEVAVYAGLAFVLGVLPIREFTVAAKSVLDKKRKKKKQ